MRRNRWVFVFVGLVIGVSVYAQEEYDLIIANGRVIDGTGNPFVYADVAVHGGVIAKIGSLQGATAKRTIDATGLFITPGFIDMHSHAMMNFHDPDLVVDRQSLTQGITTALLNPDGGFLWPIGEHLDRYRKDGLSLNVFAVVGHNGVRERAMGFNAQRLATPEEMEKMKALVKQGMEEGAFGFSTGLEGAPGRWSDTQELIELTQVVKPYGGFYHGHQRAEAKSPRWWNASMGDDAVDGIEATRETIEISEATGVPAMATHVKVIGTGFAGAADAMVRLMNEARLRGVEVYWDTYGYESYGNTPNVGLVPAWALVDEGVDIGGQDFGLRRLYDEPFARAKENLERRLEDPETAYKIRRDILYEIEKARGADNLLILGYIDEALIGRTVGDIARERGGEDPVDTILFLQRNGEQRPGGGSYRAMNVPDADNKKIVAQEFTMFCTDGGSITFGQGMPHPRYYGIFPRVIRKFVFEEGVLTLADAIRKMTSLPASVMRLKDRGLLKEGYRADVTVFDPVTIRHRSTYVRPHAYSEGIRYVLVNGVFAVDGGEVTEKLGGQVLTLVKNN